MELPSCRNVTDEERCQNIWLFDILTWLTACTLIWYTILYWWNQRININYEIGQSRCVNGKIQTRSLIRAKKIIYDNYTKLVHVKFGTYEVRYMWSSTCSSSTHIVLTCHARFYIVVVSWSAWESGIWMRSMYVVIIKENRRRNQNKMGEKKTPTYM